MKVKQFQSFVPAMLIVSMALSGCAEHVTYERDPIPQKNPSELTGEFRLLKSFEMIGTITGASIRLDATLSPKSLPFEEKFLENGRWMYVHNGFERIERTGKWFISRDQLCVSQTRDKVSCRNMWYDPQRRLIAVRHIGLREASPSICTIAPLPGHER